MPTAETPIRTQLELITPEKAEKYLGHNPAYNRALNVRAVDALSRDITAGKWHTTGQAIVFADNGDLIDGQHRLHAVLQAGVGIKALVVRGVSKEAYVALDTGRQRSFPDLLRGRGYKHVTSLSSGTRSALAWTRGNPDLRLLTINEVDAFFQENETLLVEAVRCLVAAGVHRHPVGMPPSVAVATTFIALKAGCGVDTSMEFLRQVRNGDVPDKPPFVLRNRLIQMGGVVGHSRDAVFCLALTIKAWNAYVTGTNISVLRWNPSKSEPFPVMLDTDGVVIEETRKAHDRDR